MLYKGAHFKFKTLCFSIAKNRQSQLKTKQIKVKRIDKMGDFCEKYA